MYRNLSLEDIDGEIWKPIKGYEGIYEVSNYGRVKSVFLTFTEKNGKVRSHKPRIITQHFSTTGCLHVDLFKNASKKTFKVHRLVGFAFIPCDRDDYVINHKDCNPLNNHVDNLEWTTQLGNVLHAVENHRNHRYYYPDKERAIELYKMGHSAREIAEELNVPKASIQHVMHKAGLSRKTYPRKSKYMELEELKSLIQSGMSNQEISETYNIPKEYIATRRYQIKKGVI